MRTSRSGPWQPKLNEPTSFRLQEHFFFFFSSQAHQSRNYQLRAAGRPKPNEGDSPRSPKALREGRRGWGRKKQRTSELKMKRKNNRGQRVKKRLSRRRVHKKIVSSLTQQIKERRDQREKQRLSQKSKTGQRDTARWERAESDSHQFQQR